MRTPLGLAVAWALAALWATGAAGGQTLKLRIVQASAADSSMLASPLPHTSGEPARYYAVQANFSGDGVAAFAFNIVISGEADSNGTLARLRITSSDHTYYMGAPTTSASGGARVGMANQYYYLASSNSQYNGLINTTGGGFTNTTGNQEIGLISGIASGAPMLNTPGMDPLNEGNPATWRFYGAGLTPTSLTTANLDPALAGPYFGDGGYIDVYRFRYTTSNLTSRVLTFTLTNVSGGSFDRFVYTGGVWQPVATSRTVSIGSLQVGVGSSGACCAITGACTVEAQVTCGAPDVWTSGGTCTPTACPLAGACCSIEGSCTTRIQSACAGIWHAGAACTASYCPVWVCCSLAGCSVLATGQTCAGSWVEGTCTSGVCVRGACCQKTACVLTYQASCPDWTWIGDATCTPNPCTSPTLGVCCDTTLGCQVTTRAACPSQFQWEGWGTCSPEGVYCITVVSSAGTCCTINGVCAIGLQSQCDGNWTPTGAPGTCPMQPCVPPTGACCRGATCVVTTLAQCSGAGNQFAGANLACNATGGYPCCAANYNQDPGLSVQDVFDFLGGWFAGDARADIDGGGLEVQDIFTFLNAWLAGC